MTIRLTNSKTRQKKDFTPLDPANVRMYVCGPTVYDRAHLGNARPAIVFDVLFRLLRHVYGDDHVTYVRNFTDVDDKIIARAEETGREIGQITEETTQWYLEDMAAVGVMEPTHMPRATEFIGQMVAMIATLIDQGFAYARDGHVLFRVRKYADYGHLSGRSVDDMIAGARVEVAPFKEDPMDFVLWKPSDDDLPGWDSPWGRGRPGWHIECSAMAKALLGDVFDIHGGGNDLMFPHHENEIAQSCCANGTDSMAQVWLHNEMLQVEGKKMSKSLGNFFTVRDLLDQGVPGEVIRFVMLSTHYRKPMDWTEKKREEAEGTLRKWRGVVEGVEMVAVPLLVLEVLTDDLNTAGAITALHKLAAEGHFTGLKAGAMLLGLLGDDTGGWEKSGDKWFDVLGPLLDRRLKAKSARDFATADSIRERLSVLGILLEDHPDGTTTPTVKAKAVFDFLNDLSDAQKIEIGFSVDGDGGSYGSSDEAVLAYVKYVVRSLEQS